MELFLMTFITGIMVGGIYALVALGWVLIYKCSGVLNLAMGELTLIGAYVAYSFYMLGIPFVLAVVMTLVVGIVLGVLTERIFLDKLIGEPILAVIMVTVGPPVFLQGFGGLHLGIGHEGFRAGRFRHQTDRGGNPHAIAGLSLVLHSGHRPAHRFCLLFQVHPLGPFHAGDGR